jgi:hypothetical protein
MFGLAAEGKLGFSGCGSRSGNGRGGLSLDRSGLRLLAEGLLLLRRLGLGLGLFGGSNDGVEDGAFHAGHELHNTGFSNVLDEAVDDGVAEFAVGHLAAAETQTCLDLVTFGEEANGLVLLGLVVVLVDGDGELDFLDDDDLLLLAGGAFALVFLVEEASVVLDTADGWDGIGGDFDEVEPALLGDSQSLVGRKNAELFSIFINDTDFARTDFFVDANKLTGRTLIECYGSPPGCEVSLTATRSGFQYTTGREGITGVVGWAYWGAIGVKGFRPGHRIRGF